MIAEIRPSPQPFGALALSLAWVCSACSPTARHIRRGRGFIANGCAGLHHRVCLSRHAFHAISFTVAVVSRRRTRTIDKPLIYKIAGAWGNPAARCCCGALCRRFVWTIFATLRGNQSLGLWCGRLACRVRHRWRAYLRCSCQSVHAPRSCADGGQRPAAAGPHARRASAAALPRLCRHERAVFIGAGCVD